MAEHRRHVINKSAIKSIASAAAKQAIIKSRFKNNVVIVIVVVYHSFIN